MRRNNTNGMLVVAEGLDLTGKSTALLGLKQKLEEEGCKVVYRRLADEKTAAGDAVRLGIATGSSECILIGYALDAEASIKPLLEAGYIVLQDRYIYTVGAYAQAYNKKVRQQISDIAEQSCYEPDVVLHFTAASEDRIKRLLARKNSNRFDQLLMRQPELDRIIGDYQKKGIYSGNSSVIEINTSILSPDEVQEALVNSIEDIAEKQSSVMSRYDAVLKQDVC